MADDSARRVGESVFAHATAHSERLEERLDLKANDDQFNRVVLEFVAFLLHAALVIIFDTAGRDEGERLIDGVFGHVNALGTSCSLSARHPTPPFTWRKEGIQFAGLNNDLVNARHSEYLEAERMSGGESGRIGVLSWAFGKHVSDVFPQLNDANKIQSSGAAEACVAYAAFVAALAEGLRATTERAEVLNYRQGTNVLCKACRQRKIFLLGPTTTTVRDGKRYLELTCSSGTCHQTRLYEENELEIR